MKKTLAGITAAATLGVGAIDASSLKEVPLERVEMVANERVEARQVGNIVETTLPWKGEPGIKVKYDMGEPTMSERMADKRKHEVITETVDFGDGGFKVDILLNEKPDTNVFCYQIEGAENYDFFYQPPLTQEEIDDGAHRPDDIVGSYAVYHKTLKNHRVGQTNYETGKVMHIPRPEVWEIYATSTTKEWADLSYSNGQLCVTVDQSYLDKATYPVWVDPTFGYTTAGGSYGNGFGKTTYSKAILSEDGDLTQLSMYIDWNFYGSGTFNSAIYSDSSGAASKLATADAIAKSNGVAWEDASISYSATADTYWLAESDGSGSANYRWYYDTGTAGDSDSDTTYTVLPTTASLSGTLTNYLWSIYATYTATPEESTNTGTVIFFE